MNLDINQQLFIVGGATSGFGGAIAQQLVQEGATIIAIARTKEKLETLQSTAPNQIEIIVGDLSQTATIDKIIAQIGERPIAGALINGGGPPANPALETTLAEWDEAYQKILRWKVDLTKRLMPKMMAQQYGRLVYIESVTVKQPIANLVLSNSIRMAVVGFVKTLSDEVVGHGITLNIIGPGYHNTPAVDRIFNKRAEQTGLSPQAVRTNFEAALKIGKMGDPADLGSLALWLLSPVSRHVTGQTIVVDGGFMSGVY